MDANDLLEQFAKARTIDVGSYDEMTHEDVRDATLSLGRRLTPSEINTMRYHWERFQRLMDQPCGGYVDYEEEK